MRFDATITLGNMVQLVTLLLTVVAVYVRIDRRLTQLETRMEIMFSSWARVNLPPLERAD